jgi:anti-sigma B factor antagonist
MQTTTEQTGNVRLLHLTGRLTADRHDERLPVVVQRLVDQGARVIVLNFGHVSYMDSTCLGELIGARRRVERCGGRLTMINVPPRVRRLLKLSRLTEVLLDQTRDISGRRVHGSAA